MKNFFIIALIFISHYCFSQDWNRLSFNETLQKHLDAISQKNLDVIKATVADSVTLIFPDGEVLRSKQKFVEFHINWFKDPAWKMTTEILRVQEDGQLAYGLVKYKLINYNKDGSTKSQSTTYLVLVFEKQKSGWKLVHDQNTKITM